MGAVIYIYNSVHRYCEGYLDLAYDTLYLINGHKKYMYTCIQRLNLDCYMLE